MQYKQAVHVVAAHMAGLINAGEFVEATGLEEDQVSEADGERLQRAMDEVTERLYRMGTPLPDEDAEE